MAELQYNPGVFDVGNSELARRVILTDESHPGGSSDERWEKETPYFIDLLCRELVLRKDDLVLDYGCGIGRLAKGLCERGCRVIGVDISSSMRRLAVDYVNCPGRFLVFSPDEFDLLVSKGLVCDAAFAVWVLQHCPAPDADLRRIFGALKLQGALFVANNLVNRAVPVNGSVGWFHDGVDIWALAARYFGVRNTIMLPPNLGIDRDRFLCRTYLKTAGRI